MLCALGERGKPSFLVSPFRTTNPVRLERSDCETKKNLIKASDMNKELKEALDKEEYRFRLVSVTDPKTFSGELPVSEELRYVCCSFDPTCEIEWFMR